MTASLDATDRAIINRLQDGLPASLTTFAVAADDLGIGEEVFLSELGVGDGFVAAHEFEEASVDNDLALGAIKEDPARFDFCRGDRDAIGIGEFGSEGCSRLFGRTDLHRA